MKIFEDYAFIVSGKKRKDVLKLLSFPRTPTELSKLLKVHANVITRIIKDLSARSLVETHLLEGKKKTYRLTKKGEFARQIMDNLVEPKTLIDLVKLLKVHRNLVTYFLKKLMMTGFVTIFKTTKPARKFYQLTEKGEEVREKIDT